MSHYDHNTESRKKLFRRLCIIFDALVLLAVGIFVVVVLLRAPKANYDVDRAKYPVKGIDLSAHNGNVDFLSVAADSVIFVMLKATEGTDFCDAKFNENYNAAKEAGLKVGAYHFFRFNSPGAHQAMHFLSTLQGRDFDMPIAVDVEKWGNCSTYDVTDVKRNLHEMLSTLRQAGYPVMLYTNKSGYVTFIRGDFDYVPLWICSISNPPTVGGWALWQHSHKKHVNGIASYVDVNTYNGTHNEFEAWSKPFTVTYPDSLYTEGNK